MGWRGEPGGRSRPWRSCGGIDLASCERMEGDPDAPSIEKGFGPRREKGKGGLLPGVKSRGAEEKGMFMGADLGITSGRTGSRVVRSDGEGDLWSSNLEADLSGGLGDSLGEPSFWLPSSSFLPEVDKSWGWFLVSCPLTFSVEKWCN